MSTQQIDLSDLLRPSGGISLYNPSQDIVERSYGGEIYKILPGICTLTPKTQKVTPQELRRHLCGDDGRSGSVSDIGLRPLFSDQRDELIIAEADQAFKEFQYKSDVQLKLAHMSRVAKEAAAGMPPTPPPPKVRAAMKRIVEYEKEEGLDGLHKCPHCAWPFQEEKERDYHVFEAHKEVSGTLVQAPAPVQPKKRGRPPKQAGVSA